MQVSARRGGWRGWRVHGQLGEAWPGVYACVGERAADLAVCARVCVCVCVAGPPPVKFEPIQEPNKPNFNK